MPFKGNADRRDKFPRAKYRGDWLNIGVLASEGYSSRL